MSGRISDIMNSKPSILKQLPPLPISQENLKQQPSSSVTPSAGIKRMSSTVESIGSSRDSSFEADCCSVTVAVRVRPFASRELSDPRNKRIVYMEGSETVVRPVDNSSLHRFNYDYSFDSFDESSGGFSSQQMVYESLAQPLLLRSLQGYNTCLFAYGQTGSGKSYSIMGHGDEEGIIPRFADELFKKVENLKLQAHHVSAVNIETSFFEIYNEKIYDLLCPSKSISSQQKTNLRVREHPEYGPYVEGLSTVPVSNYSDILRLLTLGNRQRATASTGMNDKSSRSHSVFTLQLTQIKTMELEDIRHEHSVVSRINLVDLAGSERQATAQTTGIRLKEGASINKSLLTLGKVISVLAESSTSMKKRKLFVPYRDSVLTWLLKESLGGNSRTAMIATISPSSLNYEETMSTLRYAQQARSIVNEAHVNEDPKARLIRELRLEIEKLKSEREGDGENVNTLQEILELRRALQEKELDLERNQLEWKRKLKEAEEKMKMESSALEHTGISATKTVENKLPYLVNLNEDPQLSEILLYILHEGQTKVGRQGAVCKESIDIQLSGALISDYHCCIVNERGKVKITPTDSEAVTYVNGQQINSTVYLQHGDRVIVGGDHYFRFSHPSSVESDKRASSGQIKDFLFAKREIEVTQNQRLENERERMKKEMEEQLQQVETTYNQRLEEQKMVYESQIKRIQSDIMVQQVRSPVAADITPLHSADKLLSSLRAEKLRQSQEQARLKSKLQKSSQKEEPAVKSLASLPTERGKTDLYKVSLLLREANKISQIKSMPIVYTQEEVDGVVVVKVTDTEFDRFTHLTIAKFEERLAELRESLYTEQTADESVLIFCNPSDPWRSSTCPQPQPLSLDEILNSENKLTLMEQVISSPNGPISSKLKTRSKVKRQPGISIFNMCKDFATYNLQKYKNTDNCSRKIFDSILRQSELCRIAVNNLSSRYQEVLNGSLKRDEFDSDDMTGTCCLQLVTSCEVLLEQMQLCGSMSDDLDSQYIISTVQRMSEVTSKISRLVVQLMQGLASSMDKAVTDCMKSLHSSILELCKLCGVMSLITDSSISIQQSNSFLQLSSEVQKACARGALDQTLHTANDRLSSVADTISYMANGEKTSFARESIYEAVMKVLTKLQVYLNEYKAMVLNSINIANAAAPSTQTKASEFDACHRYEQCAVSVTQLNTIGDNLAALSKPMFTQGKEYDRAIMLKAADTIKRCCRKLAGDSTLDMTPLSGAVNVLFTVTEAEGKVRVKHKPSPDENKQRRQLPQLSKADKIRRVLPTSPEKPSSSQNNSPSKSVQKLTALFDSNK